MKRGSDHGDRGANVNQLRATAMRITVDTLLVAAYGSTSM